MKGPLFRGGQTGRRGSKGSRVATAPVRTLDYRNTEGKTKPKASRRLPGKGMCHRDLEEAGARQAERCKAAFQIERIQGVKHPWEWLGHQVPGRGEESINQLLLGLQETGWGEGWGRAGVGGGVGGASGQDQRSGKLPCSWPLVIATWWLGGQATDPLWVSAPTCTG